MDIGKFQRIRYKNLKRFCIIEIYCTYLTTCRIMSLLTGEHKNHIITASSLITAHVLLVCIFFVAIPALIERNVLCICYSTTEAIDWSKRQNKWNKNILLDDLKALSWHSLLRKNNNIKDETKTAISNFISVFMWFIVQLEV